MLQSEEKSDVDDEVWDVVNEVEEASRREVGGFG